ncbi:MAG TPA: heavy metal-binding domain-containing protein [Propionibacteriaceae bacterium]|nr:heavy metal-binding domain-containing protein [Propionibacteriaceae bacterium]
MTSPGMNPGPRSVVTGLSGNELFCIDRLGYRAGDLLVGNSVYSLGLLGGIGSAFNAMAGGEVTQITEMITAGRHLSTQRLMNEMRQAQMHGATGMSSELIFHAGNVEFLSVASGLYRKDGQMPQWAFTTSADAQELWCQEDAGYAPVAFVMGNVAYSIGVGRGIAGAFKQLQKGEVKQYSDIFTHTRNLALQRIVGEAQSVGANAVVGIKTSILPFGGTGVQEMLMVGTAARHDMSDAHFARMGVTTSDLTAEETWNLAKIGYSPLMLVLGTSVYSLGFVGGLMASFKNYVKGEISELTELIYAAREESLGKVRAQASSIGADDVVGVKTYIYDLGGGLIEFLAIGTAVKKTDSARTATDTLPAQAIIRDKDTFVNAAERGYGVSLTQE